MGGPPARSATGLGVESDETSLEIDRPGTGVESGADTAARFACPPDVGAALRPPDWDLTTEPVEWPLAELPAGWLTTSEGAWTADGPRLQVTETGADESPPPVVRSRAGDTDRAVSVGAWCGGGALARAEKKRIEQAQARMALPAREIRRARFMDQKMIREPESCEGVFETKTGPGASTGASSPQEEAVRQSSRAGPSNQQGIRDQPLRRPRSGRRPSCRCR